MDNLSFKYLKDDTLELQKDDYLWRYVSKGKLEDFLATKTIYFSRCDRFSDIYEFARRDELIPMTRQWAGMKDIPDGDWNSNLPADWIASAKDFQRSPNDYISSELTKRQKQIYVSCWFISDTNRESNALWEIYSKHDGFAIRIKAVDLIRKMQENLNTLPSMKNFDEALMGKIEYHDFFSHKFYEYQNDDDRWIFRKDVSYDFEKEFRFLLHSKNLSSIDSVRLPIHDYDDIDLEVICHPSTSYDDYIDLQTKYILGIRLKRSELLLRKIPT